MSYITREDGVHFVIPSYRDVLTVKSKKAIQGDVIALSKRYGEYLAMQRKSQLQYDVAFSPDAGYLLGETVWKHFHNPVDMIFCEAVPNSTEAILVIVKGGNVYLDGSFPIDGIQDELVIFLTQQNQFEIYTYGNVPISEKPEDGKFSFDGASVKSFKVLDEPVIKSLPLINDYQLKLMEITLKEHGIGSLPIKQLAVLLAPVAFVVLLIFAIVSLRPAPQEIKIEPNPYQVYVDAMISPAPDEVMAMFLEKLELLYSAPGWNVSVIKYEKGTVEALMKSGGSSIESLIEWGNEHDASIIIRPAGVIVSMSIKSANRAKPREVFPTKEALAIFIDRLSKVYPGNNLSIEINQAPAPVSSYTVGINIIGRSPLGLKLIGEQMKGLPLILESISLSTPGVLLDGRIILKTLGK